MTRVNVDDKALKAIGRALTSWCAANPPPAARRAAVHGRQPDIELGRRFPILAVDPGKRSMGWCFLDVDGRLHSGQGAPADVVDEIDATLDVFGAPILFTAEAPYTVSAQQLARPGARGGVQSIHALGRAVGFVEGALRAQLARAARWEPPPMTWRSALGLNRRATDDATARDATAQAVLEWVRVKTKLAMRTADGSDRVDEAMAIALAGASQVLVRAIHQARIRGGTGVQAARTRPRAERRIPSRDLLGGTAAG